MAHSRQVILGVVFQKFCEASQACIYKHRRGAEFRPHKFSMGTLALDSPTFSVIRACSSGDNASRVEAATKSVFGKVYLFLNSE